MAGKTQNLGAIAPLFCSTHHIHQRKRKQWLAREPQGKMNQSHPPTGRTALPLHFTPFSHENRFPRCGCRGFILINSVMYNYIVVLEFPGKPFPESLQSFEVLASNRYAARKLAMHKHCKHALWWCAILKDWGP